MGTTVTVKSYRPEREREIVDQLYKNMEKVGLVVERQAKINVSKSPPEHPQVQTGRLRSSIIHQVTKEDNNIVAEIGSNVVYSKFLEFGTINHPPYPWLYPAVIMQKDKITDILATKEFDVAGIFKFD